MTTRPAPAFTEIHADEVVAVLFPTRARVLDAAWRLLTAVDGARQRGEVLADPPLRAWMSRFEEPRPELFLSPKSYELARKITIRLRDTEVRLMEEPPPSAFLVLDTASDKP